MGRERRRHSAGEVRWDRASRLAGCVLFCHNHLINYAFVILEEVLSLPILDGNEVKTDIISHAAAFNPTSSGTTRWKKHPFTNKIV